MTTCFACKLPWTMLPFQMRAYTLKGKNLLLMSRFFALRERKESAPNEQILCFKS